MMSPIVSPTECGECGREYNEGVRCPRIFNCTHTLCQECVENLLKTKHKRCPFCQEALMASSATEFKVNIAVLELARCLRRKEPEKPAFDQFKEQLLKMNLRRTVECHTSQQQINEVLSDALNLQENFKRENKRIENDLLPRIHEILARNNKAISELKQTVKNLQQKSKEITGKNKLLIEAKMKLDVCTDELAKDTMKTLTKAGQHNNSAGEMLISCRSMIAEEERTLDLKNKELNAVSEKTRTLFENLTAPEMVRDVFDEREKKEPQYTSVALVPPPVISQNDDSLEKILQDEFKKAFKLTKQHHPPMTISNQNKHLNRFPDIGPYDHTIVTVSNVNYINASYIMNGKFIATQDPLPNQDDDLWQMIWDCNVRVILRLSNDDAARPTAVYIHDEVGGEWVMGRDELLVSVKNIEQNSCFQKRTITVTKNADSREIEHFHMTCWPEGGYPTVEDLLQVVTAGRNANNAIVGHVAQPVLVHCSSGSGRTGTAIALWCMMDEYEDKFFSSLIKTVKSLREDRMDIVQTEEQYMLVYKCFQKFQERSMIIRGDDYEYE